MSNILRSFIQVVILLAFFLCYLVLHGAHGALMGLSPAGQAVICGLLLLAGLQKVIPFLLRRFRHQPEPPPPQSTAEWRLTVLTQMVSLLLLLVVDNMGFLLLLLTPPLFMRCGCATAPDRKG